MKGNDSMKNIVYIVSQLRKSGPINVLYNLVSNLDYTKFHPIVVKLMQDDPDKSDTPRFRRLNIEIIELNYSFWQLELKSKWVALQLDELFISRKIDIIHSHGYQAMLIMSYMRKDAFKIDTQHCISFDSFKQSRGNIIGLYMHYRYLNRLKKINLGVSISQTVCSFYQKYISEIPFTVIYNGIDINRFRMGNKVELRRHLDILEDNIVFVVVGHLSKLKDPIIVIEAFKDLIKQKKIKNVLLFFCGEGNLRTECEHACRCYPEIKILGYVDNVDEYLKAADFSICASHSEGFGLNYVESLLAGTIVISSNIPVFNELSAYFPILKKLQFKVGDLNSLKESILAAINSRIDSSEIAYQAIARFSSFNMAESYMKVYEMNDYV